MFRSLILAAGLVALSAAASAEPASRPIHFPAANGGEVTGEVITGEGRRPHPAVLFVHWLGAPKTTNHTEFEADAKALAACGVTSVLVDTMWSKPDWFETMGKSAEADRAATAGQITDLGHAVDLLMKEPGVDRRRVAYVGHDFGAMFGALLAGQDHRPSRWVFMAAVPALADWYLFRKTNPDEAAYRAALKPFDIPKALGDARGHFLLQFADKDFFIPEVSAKTFVEAVPQPRTLETYAAKHDLAVPKAVADRRAWLARELGCKPGSVASND